MIIIEASTKKHNKPLRDIEVEYEIDKAKCEQCSEKPCLNVCPINAIYTNGEDGNINIDEKCFGCVICREICPFDAIKMETKFADPIRENVPNINSKLCKACGACVSVCKTGAIHLASSGTEQVHSEIDEDKCVSCGYCFRSCPTDAIKFGEILPKSVSRGRAIVVNEKKCIGCMTCKKTCPSTGAINLSKINKLPYIDPSYCTRCEECMNACPSTAIKYSSRKKAYELFNKLKLLDTASMVIDKDIKSSKKDFTIDSLLLKLANVLSSKYDEDIEIDVTDLILDKIKANIDSDVSLDYVKDLPYFPPIRKIKVHEDKCIGCGKCVDTCPENSVWLEKPSPIHIGNDCVCCGKCVSTCQDSAIELHEILFETKSDDSTHDRIFFIRRNIEGEREV
jgi:energy-converting hydrogenase A subunit Q